ncbi:TetR/AcrR family transcriptional regulator [Nocardioides immobilis]|uniref:TetR/AcrR family transcriptional regulator n=1 Tax=Nocardioides immobilis TaxID=2049295 RepID=A0A417XWK6_9ACTN|nr:TetR/AcrR family transcriptional regulator [Nocardioides immobilis]RHW24756.1 TetR/AcrR family transcriptional regulator [Nocardioides immobilis]
MGSTSTGAGSGERSRGDDARARLLDSAVNAFAERGYHATTTRDIASAAGMSPAAVYVHYRTKHDLLAQISLAGHEQTLALIQEAVASAPSPADQLARVVRQFAIHHARGNTGARVVNYELSSLEPGPAAEVRELRRAISAEIRALVERGVADGSFDCPQPRIAATAILSLGIDVARWYREDRTWSPEDLGDAYAAIALRIVGARPS